MARSISFHLFFYLYKTKSVRTYKKNNIKNVLWLYRTIHRKIPVCKSLFFLWNDWQFGNCVKNICHTILIIILSLPLLVYQCCKRKSWLIQFHIDRDRFQAFFKLPRILLKRIPKQIICLSLLYDLFRTNILITDVPSTGITCLPLKGNIENIFQQNNMIIIPT